MSATFLLVVTSVGSRDEANRIASYYVWDDAVRHEGEFRILFKVAASAYEEAERAIRSLHSYDLPAIHAIAVERAHAPYADWVIANSTPQARL